jgi:hypothetical protein
VAQVGGELLSPSARLLPASRICLWWPAQAREQCLKRFVEALRDKVTYEPHIPQYASAEKGTVPENGAQQGAAVAAAREVLGEVAQLRIGARGPDKVLQTGVRAFRIMRLGQHPFTLDQGKTVHFKP